MDKKKAVSYPTPILCLDVNNLIIPIGDEVVLWNKSGKEFLQGVIALWLRYSIEITRTVAMQVEGPQEAIYLIWPWDRINHIIPVVRNFQWQRSQSFRMKTILLLNGLSWVSVPYSLHLSPRIFYSRMENQLPLKSASSAVTSLFFLIYIAVISGLSLKILFKVDKIDVILQ